MRKIYFSFLTVFACLLGATNQSSAQCFENFDAVAAPVLPVGWTAVTNVSGGGTTPWVTSTSSSFSASNAVFTNNATDISDEWLNSAPYTINSTSATLTFRNRFDLETGFDGMVLEISIGGGAFTDILAAGGSFVAGGYTGTISVNFGSPIAGRQAWTGNSGGFILTTVNLPASANGQAVILRWRRATDSSFGNTGAFVDNVVVCGTSTCVNPPAAITSDPSGVTICVGANTSFTVGATGAGISYQWQVNNGSGFTNIANGSIYGGATTATLTITGAPASFNTYQYRAVVTGLCNSVNSLAATLTLNQSTISNILATPSTVCAPGASLITFTASSSTAGSFTHTLTGAGTIVQNPPTGANNQNASFSVTGIPAGQQSYTITSTVPGGCPGTANVIVNVNATPVITFNPASPSVCLGSVVPITATVTPPIPQLAVGGGSITIPTTLATGNPYPSQFAVTGLPTTGVTIKSVTINGFSHTFPGDLDIVLQSPTGTNVILMSDRGSGDDINNISLTFDDAAAALVPAAAITGGTYRPTNTAGPDVWPAPGPGSITQVNPTFANLGTGDYNGLWKLFVNDQANGDGGSISDWNITFNIPVPVTYSPLGTLFTDPAGTIAYTGTPVYGPIYAKPTVATTYTANATRNGCPAAAATVSVSINQLPAITTQPSPATQTICTGTNVTWTVAATGTNLTYQWRKNGVNLLNGGQLNGTIVSGATTNALTLSIVSATDAANYDVVVGGTCTPSVTSTPVALVIATAPTITTQPANFTTCAGGTATFSVVAAGSPAPAFYQWQVSTTAVPAFTNVTVGSFATPSLVLPGVTTAMSGNKYRVIITNVCGQSITTNGTATLTVNAAPAPGSVTATSLPARICLSNAPIALVGSPVGGSWSGIGVSGSNFVPGATAVGNYTLTYTSVNSVGCPATTTIVANVVSDLECVRENRLKDKAVILYPNPNSGNFFIRINSILYNYLNMRVYNASGNLVSIKNYSGLVYGQVIPIDLTHLPSGSYMVRFFYDDGARTSEKVFPVFINRK